MSYASLAAGFGARVQWLVEIDLDRCSKTYGTVAQSGCGVPADLGDGARCWYSWQTCQLPLAYARSTRTLRFCLNEVPWPDPAVVCYPLLSKHVEVPQQIRLSDLVVTPATLRLDFCLDFNPTSPDWDRARYNSTRAGEFWANLVARNRNYVNRKVRLYRGFAETGFALADFQRVGPEYKIQECLRTENGFSMNCRSVLADLSKAQIPWGTSGTNVLLSAVTTTSTTITVRDAKEFPDPANYTRNAIFVQVEGEIMQVASVSGNTLTVTRGQQWTDAAPHVAGQPVSHVVALGDPTNGRSPVDVLRDLLEWGGITDAQVNQASFDDERDFHWPAGEIYALLTEQQALADIAAKIREPRNLLIYLDRDGKFTCKSLAPATPSVTLTDAHFVAESVTVESSDYDRLTRVSLWYDADVEQAHTDSGENFTRGVVCIDASLEDPNNYGDVKSEIMSDVYLLPSTLVSVARNIARRIVMRRKNGISVVTFTLQLHDATLEPGDDVNITTDQILGTDGLPSSTAYTILSRATDSRNPTLVRYSADAINIAQARFARFAPDSVASDYSTASAADKQYGYFGDANNLVNNGVTTESGYVFW